MICIHGQLEDNCYICDLESYIGEIEAEIAELKKQLKGKSKQTQIDKETVQYLDEQWLEKARPPIK